MAVVTPIPFAIGLLVGMGLFGALTYYLVQESRRPVHWPAPGEPRTPPVAHPSRRGVRGVHGLVAVGDGSPGQRVALSAKASATRV